MNLLFQLLARTANERNRIIYYAVNKLRRAEAAAESVPLFAVPTTFAGADLSVAAAITYPTTEGGRSETIPVADWLMTAGLFYDSGFYETITVDVSVGSAFNGFDKALEMAYSAFANPLADVTAARGLAYLNDSLPDLRGDAPVVMERAVVGMLLAQYGLSIPEKYTCNVIHAFGHGLRTSSASNRASRTP